MPILVPPAVFEKEDAVLDLPVSTHGREQLLSANFARIAAGEKVSRVRKTDRAVVGNDITIDANRDLAARKAERVANIGRVV
jgi:hypothetical protein